MAIAIAEQIERKASESVAKNVPILSFFTGAGFLDLGFIQAGFDIIWSNEFHPGFVRGYEYAMEGFALGGTGHRITNSNSIVTLGPNQIAREAFRNTPIPATFGIIGGPPCPDFSVGGKNRGREGENGRLSQVYVMRIMELQPSFFLFENVPGLLRTTKHRHFFNFLRRELQQDYIIDYRILNALEYGVPQDRERLFLVGFHKKWLKKQYGIEARWMPTDWFPWPRKTYPDAKDSYIWPEQSPFGETPEKPDGIPEELMIGPLICDVDELARLPNGLEGFLPKSRRFSQIAEGDVSRKSFKRLHRWRYSPTAAYGNNEVHLHPTEPRRLTVREALRVQSVPDDYVMHPDMTLTDKFKTIGNGVPVKLALKVALAFKTMLGGD
jgi:DNA (cytosine-5)-methyltransferase 1